MPYRLSNERKYRHNGGMTLRTSSARRLWRRLLGSMIGTFGPLFGSRAPRARRPAGSMIGTMAPTTAPLEVVDLQEK